MQSYLHLACNAWEFKFHEPTGNDKLRAVQNYLHLACNISESELHEPTDTEVDNLGNRELPSLAL